jgi:hypothetical protein
MPGLLRASPSARPTHLSAIGEWGPISAWLQVVSVIFHQLTLLRRRQIKDGLRYDHDLRLVRDTAKKITSQSD